MSEKWEKKSEKWKKVPHVALIRLRSIGIPHILLTVSVVNVDGSLCYFQRWVHACQL